MLLGFLIYGDRQLTLRSISRYASAVLRELYDWVSPPKLAKPTRMFAGEVPFPNFLTVMSEGGRVRVSTAPVPEGRQIIAQGRQSWVSGAKHEQRASARTSRDPHTVKTGAPPFPRFLREGGDFDFAPDLPWF